jgi:spore coat polysaccharide biosynthesis protein SpsF
MPITPQRIGIISQARMTSTRLPGKIFKEIKGKSLLEYHIERLKKTNFDLLIATTINKTDDCICEWAEKHKIEYYRGSENNVLSRYYEAAKKYGFDTIVRVTSDCPLIDASLVCESIKKYLEFNNQNLYMSNSLERTYAYGFDFEIFSFQMLKEAFQKAADPSDLEHVTPYIWKDRSGKTEFYFVKQNEDNSRWRITVDTEYDFELIKTLIEKFNADKLGYRDIEKTLNENPELTLINSHVKQRKV